LLCDVGRAAKKNPTAIAVKKKEIDNLFRTIFVAECWDKMHSQLHTTSLFSKKIL